MPMAAMIIIKKKNNAPNFFTMMVPSLGRNKWFSVPRWPAALKLGYLKVSCKTRSSCVLDCPVRRDCWSINIVLCRDLQRCRVAGRIGAQSAVQAFSTMLGLALSMIAR
jgi:hypothetical protein